MKAPNVTTGPSTSGVVLVLGSGLLLVGLVLGLVFIAGADGQADVFTWLSSVFALVAAATGTGAVVQSRRLLSNVDTVREQTNGSLDARIEAAMSRVVSKVDDQRKDTRS